MSQAQEIARSWTRSGAPARARRCGSQISSLFVPKPHTPSQRAGSEPVESLNEKYFNQGRWRRRNVKAKWETRQESSLQAALARGDERLGQVVDGCTARAGVFQERTESSTTDPLARGIQRELAGPNERWGQDLV